MNTLHYIFFVKKLKNNKIKKIYFVPDQGRVNLISKVIEEKCEINKLDFIENTLQMDLNFINSRSKSPPSYIC